MTAAGPRADAAQAPPSLIYVVEDDTAISKLVVAALHEFGFATEAFRNGASVLRRLQTERPELCIVDLGLPDMDGIELVRQIAAVSTSGVLIVTGRGHTVDRVMGLELGADDYMVKPFEPRELVARVRSILRRRAGTGRSTEPEDHQDRLWRRLYVLGRRDLVVIGIQHITPPGSMPRRRQRHPQPSQSWVNVCSDFA
jgi:DNA-binding response OmpR family regulator